MAKGLFLPLRLVNHAALEDALDVEWLERITPPLVAGVLGELDHPAIENLQDDLLASAGLEGFGDLRR